jgi:uncharacterized membrane protein YeaQ/YmgE (transglycosylase-associated protein family)
MMAFDLPYLLPIIAAGVISGWLAGLVTRGRGLGLAGNILVAVGGAAAGVYVFDSLGIGFGQALIDSTIAGFAGAFLTLVFIGWLRR